MTEHKYYPGRVFPRTVIGNIHFWLTIAFFVSVFGPYFDLWMNSGRLVGGVPLVIVWTLSWCAVQTVNMLVAYFTIMRPWAERHIERARAQADQATEHTTE